MKNTSAVKVIFYFKMFNIEFKFRKLKKKKIKKKLFFVSEIISSENVPINFLYEEENTCYRQSMG